MSDDAGDLKKLMFDHLGDLDRLDQLDAEIAGTLADIDAIEAEGGDPARIARLRANMAAHRTRSEKARQRIILHMKDVRDRVVDHAEALDAEIARRKAMS